MSNVTQTDIKVLKFLSKQTDYVSQAEIGRDTGIEDQSTTDHRDWNIRDILKDLQSKDLVERTKYPKRKEGSEWKITEKGRGLIFLNKQKGGNKELEQINQRMTELFQEWQTLQPLKAKDQERFDKKARLDWNYHSNKIEGNTLTYGQTELLLIFGRYDGGHLERNYLEMQAHDVAINKVKEFAKDKDRNLTEADIRDLNKIILKEPFWSKAQAPDGTPTQKQIIPGQYKTQPNHVQTATGEIFKFAEPHEVPLKMEELIKWLRKEMESPTLSMASLLAELHHRFILIHPFDDGNGRIVRLLLNYVLLRLGYPPLVVKSNDRENYLIAINKADASDIESFAIYLGKVLMDWLDIGIKAGRGEDISEASDVDKEVGLFIREQESKGLNKHFSKESAINVVDNLSEILLFDIFKNKFKDFNNLFHFIEKPEQKIILLSKNKRKESKFKDIQDIKKHINPLSSILFKDDIFFIHVDMTLSYNSYQGERNKILEEPFNDIDASLVLVMDKFKYNINMFIDSTSYESIRRREENVISEERYYNQLLTQDEANRFIAEGKKKFLKLLKEATGKDTDDKK